MADSAATLFAGDRELPFDAAAAVRRLRGSDGELAGVMDRVGTFGLRLQEAPSTYEALAEAIVYQQLTGKAATTIFGRLRRLAPDPDRFLAPRELLDLGDDALRGAGVSRPKAAALRDLAARTLAGTVPDLPELGGLADEAVVARLVAIRGIGRWTAEMLLIFNLGRPDVLPLADYGLRKGFMRAFGTADMPGPEEVARRGERWRPYRTVASWYLWRASELPPVLH